MERQDVYRAIDSERAYQQAEGKPDEHKPTEWLDSIEYYCQKAWSNTHTEPLMDNLRKIAALAVAALEQYGCEPREGFEVQPQPASVPDDEVLDWLKRLVLARENEMLCYIQRYNYEENSTQLATCRAALAWLDAQPPQATAPDNDARD